MYQYFKISWENLFNDLYLSLPNLHMFSISGQLFKYQHQIVSGNCQVWYQHSIFWACVTALCLTVCVWMGPKMIYGNQIHVHIGIYF